MPSKWNGGRRRGLIRVFAVGLLALLPVMAALAQLQAVNLQGTDPIDAVAIVLTRFGPYPNSFTHPATPFLLAIVNRSGVLEDTFSLLQGSGGTGNSLLDLHSTSARQRDHQIIKPLPGDYRLLFKAHPDWVVNITITAQ